MLVDNLAGTPLGTLEQGTTRTMVCPRNLIGVCGHACPILHANLGLAKPPVPLFGPAVPAGGAAPSNFFGGPSFGVPAQNPNPATPAAGANPLFGGGGLLGNAGANAAAPVQSAFGNTTNTTTPGSLFGQPKPPTPAGQGFLGVNTNIAPGAATGPGLFGTANPAAPSATPNPLFGGAPSAAGTNPPAGTAAPVSAFGAGGFGLNPNAGAGSTNSLFGKPAAAPTPAVAPATNPSSFFAAPGTNSLANAPPLGSTPSATAPGAAANPLFTQPKPGTPSCKSPNSVLVRNQLTQYQCSVLLRQVQLQQVKVCPTDSRMKY